jgi:hypothetical protein
MSTLTVPARFCGPARSGNGGWSAGALAAYVDAPTVTVRLQRPPPLETPLAIEDRDGWTVATVGREVVLQARAAVAEPVPVAPVDRAVARAAEASFAGLESHPFPTCFSCGPREDGLQIFPGPSGPGRVAATWTPAASVTLPDTWAAIDCAGAWAAGMAERTMVLGQLTARVESLPVAGEEHVVVGEVRGGEGRKVLAATSSYDSSGRLVATAEAVWILVDADGFN